MVGNLALEVRFRGVPVLLWRVPRTAMRTMAKLRAIAISGAGNPGRRSALSRCVRNPVGSCSPKVVASQGVREGGGTIVGWVEPRSPEALTHRNGPGTRWAFTPDGVGIIPKRELGEFSGRTPADPFHTNPTR
jgi:hypothetical protein